MAAAKKEPYQDWSCSFSVSLILRLDYELNLKPWKPQLGALIDKVSGHYRGSTTGVSNEGYPKVPENFTITEKAPTY